jgi:hypothetical protein
MYRSRRIIFVIRMFRRSIDVFRRTVGKQASSVKCHTNALTCPRPLAMDSFDVHNFATSTDSISSGVYSTSRAAFAVGVDGKFMTGDDHYLHSDTFDRYLM